MDTIHKRATLKWVHAVFLITLRLELGSGHRVLHEKDQGIYKPNNAGFELGGTWSFPFLGNRPIGGFLGFGSDDGSVSTPQFGFSRGSFEGGNHGRPRFRFGGGGGFGGGTNGYPGFVFGFGGGTGGGGGRRGPDGANSRSSGCNCECCRSGEESTDDGSGNGGTGSSNDGGQHIRVTESLTCIPMNCPSNGDCGGHHRYFDGSPPYWCDVPGTGVYPFWCPGGLDKSGQSSSCIPMSGPDGAACRDGCLGHQQNGAVESQKVNNNVAAGHN